MNFIKIFVYNTITFTELAQLFILYAFSKHSVPSHVFSDYSLEFVSNFFCFLGITLKIYLYFTSDYHSEDNKQTEYMNQTLKQYLYINCNYQQDNWSELLSLVEFFFNNTFSATISIFLSFANEIYIPSILIYLQHNMTFSQAHIFVEYL